MPGCCSSVDPPPKLTHIFIAKFALNYLPVNLKKRCLRLVSRVFACHKDYHHFHILRSINEVLLCTSFKKV